MLIFDDIKFSRTKAQVTIFQYKPPRKTQNKKKRTKIRKEKKKRKESSSKLIPAFLNFDRETEILRSFYLAAATNIIKTFRYREDPRRGGQGKGGLRDT